MAEVTRKIIVELEPAEAMALQALAHGLQKSISEQVRQATDPFKRVTLEVGRGAMGTLFEQLDRGIKNQLR